jgi:hypothetical protein
MSTGGTFDLAHRYDVAITIPDPGANSKCHHVPTLPVLSRELRASCGLDAVIGRDVLKDCLLVYDGPAETFSLTF